MHLHIEIHIPMHIYVNNNNYSRDHESERVWRLGIFRRGKWKGGNYVNTAYSCIKVSKNYLKK